MRSWWLREPLAWWAPSLPGAPRCLADVSSANSSVPDDNRIYPSPAGGQYNRRETVFNCAHNVGMVPSTALAQHRLKVVRYHRLRLRLIDFPYLGQFAYDHRDIRRGLNDAVWLYEWPVGFGEDSVTWQLGDYG